MFALMKLGLNIFVVWDKIHRLVRDVLLRFFVEPETLWVG